MRLLPFVCGAVFGLVSTASAAASFVVVNADAPGVGFNDTTPAAPVGANTAATLGAQRLAVLDAALDYWGARLDSAVPIHVQARYQEGACTEASSFIVNASPVTGRVAQIDDEEVWATTAHHNALTGVDATPANAEEADYDILLSVNPLIDTGCAGVDGWWYDTDATVPPPSTRLPFLAVLKLELARGLGQWVFGDPATGTRGMSTEGNAYSDAIDAHLLDLDFGRWSQLDEFDRSLSAINHPRLVWDGAHVNAAAAGWLEPAPLVVLHGAGGDAFEFTKGRTLGPRPPLLGTLAAPVVSVADDTEPVGDGCQTLVNAAALAGRIALVDRGDCTFAEKAIAAQNAGAIAVLVANNVEGYALSPMGGSDPALVIPALGITQAAGMQLRADPSARASIGYSVLARAGTTDGRVRMTADAVPPTYRTITQFADASQPNALPRYNYGFTSSLDDLSFALLRDIQWPVSATAPNAAPYLDIPDTFEAVADQPSTLTELWFGDIDVGDGSMTLRFEVSSGAIVLAADAVVLTSGSGSDTASITGPRSALLSYVVRGAVQFLSAPGDDGDVDLTVTIDDNGHTGSGGAKTATDLATIMLVANGAPAAIDQSLETTMVTPLAIDLAGTDPDGDGLAFGVTTQPQHGTLTGGLGRLIYTPDADFSGVDSFDFVALDGVLASAPATVAITVEGKVGQTITAFSATPSEPLIGDGSFTVSATGGASGNPVTFSIAPASAAVCAAGGTHGATIAILAVGTCTVLADQAGNVTYDPAPQLSLAVTIFPTPPLVRDGGFEAGTVTTYWEQGSTNFGSPLCDAACGGNNGPHSGAFWVWFGGVTDAEAGFVQQTGVIAPQQRTLTFFLRSTNGLGDAPDPDAAFNVTIDGNTIFSVEQADAGTYAAGYTHVSLDVSAYADGGEHTLRFALDKVANSAFPDFHLDDINLQSDTVFSDGFE